jgi:asparagine synthase (glutamine-hydrolysing)
MCRIFGYFNTTVPRHRMLLAGAAQRHGGPDEQGLATGAGWGLGADRLSVIDRAGGRQPYRAPDVPGVTVVFNGELYNHGRLRAMLAARGYTFADHCDGSVLPALYAEFGAEFTILLDGMYAVAVVDERSGPTLLLATDGVGMKPLYYQLDQVTGRLLFASELPALLALGGTSPRLRPEAFDEYLTTKAVFGAHTMFAGIDVLLPATVLALGPDGTARSTVRRPGHPEGALPPAAPQRLRSLLQSTVPDMLEADVPLCAVTSGGLDSSLVTALAREHVQELDTFTIGYVGDWPHDEQRYAQAVADHCGTRHHPVHLDPKDFPDLLPQVVWHLGQPNADPITLSTYGLFRAIRASGFTVALTGDGADEVFGGYDRVVAAAADSTAGWAERYVDALAAVPPQLRRRLYAPDYRAQLESAGTARDRLLDQLGAAGGSRLDRLTGLEIDHRLPAYHLRRVDHLSMASSVEVRLPFCQPDVVGFGRSLPPELRVRAGQGKWALREAARGLLPGSVLDRPKQPFTLPLDAMLRPGQPLFEHCVEVLTDPTVKRVGLVKPWEVEELLTQQADRPGAGTALAIWSMLIFTHWVDVFDVAAP